MRQQLQCVPLPERKGAVLDISEGSDRGKIKLLSRAVALCQETLVRTPCSCCRFELGSSGYIKRAGSSIDKESKRERPRYSYRVRGRERKRNNSYKFGETD